MFQFQGLAGLNSYVDPVNTPWNDMAEGDYSNTYSLTYYSWYRFRSVSGNPQDHLKIWFNGVLVGEMFGNDLPIEVKHYRVPGDIIAWTVSYASGGNNVVVDGTGKIIIDDSDFIIISPNN